MIAIHHTTAMVKINGASCAFASIKYGTRTCLFSTGGALFAAAFFVLS